MQPAYSTLQYTAATDACSVEICLRLAEVEGRKPWRIDLGSAERGKQWCCAPTILCEEGELIVPCMSFLTDNSSRPAACRLTPASANNVDRRLAASTQRTAMKSVSAMIGARRSLGWGTP